MLRSAIATILRGWLSTARAMDGKILSANTGGHGPSKGCGRDWAFALLVDMCRMHLHFYFILVGAKEMSSGREASITYLFLLG